MLAGTCVRIVDSYACCPAEGGAALCSPLQKDPLITAIGAEIPVKIREIFTDLHGFAVHAVSKVVQDVEKPVDP